jgi:hypothetical protein
VAGTGAVGGLRHDEGEVGRLDGRLDEYLLPGLDVHAVLDDELRIALERRGRGCFDGFHGRS